MDVKGKTVVVTGVQAGSKLAKAQSLGVTVADEAALQKILGDKTVSKAKLTARKAADDARKKLEAEALAGAAAPPSDFKGKTVVVTGTLSIERAEMETLLREAGARVTGSISKQTQFLVVGAGAGSKLTQATALGITTLTEAQARAVLGGKPQKKKKK